MCVQFWGLHAVCGLISWRDWVAWAAILVPPAAAAARQAQHELPLFSLHTVTLTEYRGPSVAAAPFHCPAPCWRPGPGTFCQSGEWWSLMHSPLPGWRMRPRIAHVLVKRGSAALCFGLPNGVLSVAYGKKCRLGGSFKAAEHGRVSCCWGCYINQFYFINKFTLT